MQAFQRLVYSRYGALKDQVECTVLAYPVANDPNIAYVVLTS